MASSHMSTILIFGGTGGIGESFARSFHKQGKKVIITGRREDRLAALAKEMQGLETYTMDNGDLASIPKHVAALTKKYPAIDTVWVNSGIQYMGDFKSLDNFSDDKIIRETNVNFTAPMILARHFVPFLLSQSRKTTFMITSSGIAFVPNAMFPVYSPTKAAVHSFLVALRASLAGSSLAVIEIAPPYVRTDLDAANRLDHLVTPMELDEYTTKTMDILSSGDVKEAAVGFAEMGRAAWRGAFDPILKSLHNEG